MANVKYRVSGGIDATKAMGDDRIAILCVTEPEAGALGWTTF